VTGHYRAPEKLLAELGITEPEEIDLPAIAMYCGAIVVEQDLRGCEARLIGRDDRAFITVNAASSPERKRWSVGHELGHWMHHRGTAAFRCGKRDLKEFLTASPEQQANQYSVDLLLPRSMFLPRAARRPITLATVEDLARTFGTSLTATAIRLVQLGSSASMVVVSDRNGMRWSIRNQDVPDAVRLRPDPSPDTVAYDLARGAEDPGHPADVGAAGWFEDDAAERTYVQEDSRHITRDLILTLLWWPDEAHLLAYAE
jgi:Zn-dependent peptidase ImmA (M78 family)